MKPSSFQQTAPNLKIAPQFPVYMSKEDLSLAGEVKVETGWIIQQEKKIILYGKSKPETDTNQKII